jgi:A/G-specific adenine glycosylase
MLNPAQFRRDLLRWYAVHKRDLPWRRTRDPYRIWVSEIMLQQTRAAAVIPYYERFLDRFPDVTALAAAPEAELLAAWAGLGYYSRARNLQAAAKRIQDRGAFPGDYEAIRELPGIGDYTAAAVSSIAFGLPHAVLDGNVLRVLSRITTEPGDVRSSATRKRIGEIAGGLIGHANPGEFNQALMELGATLCLPRNPKCLLCPVTGQCAARSQGTQGQFPVKQRREQSCDVEQRLLIVEREGELLLWQRPADSPRMAGFWELPEASQLTRVRMVEKAGAFSHTIVNTRYRFQVFRASIPRAPAGFHWLNKESLSKLPLSTTAKKALACLSLAP